MFQKLLVASVLIAGMAYAAPACVSSATYDYNDLGSDGCSLGNLRLSDFQYGEAGIGSVWNVLITPSGINQLVLSGLIGADLAEGSGFSQSFTIGGLTHAYSRTITFAGSCSYDPSEGDPNRSLSISLDHHRVKSKCEGEDEVHTITEWFGPSANHEEYGRYAVGILGMANKAAYDVTVVYSFHEVPEPATIVLFGLGFSGMVFVRSRRNRANSPSEQAAL